MHSLATNNSYDQLQIVQEPLAHALEWVEEVRFIARHQPRVAARGCGSMLHTCSSCSSMRSCLESATSRGIRALAAYPCDHPAQSTRARWPRARVDVATPLDRENFQVYVAIVNLAALWYQAIDVAYVAYISSYLRLRYSINLLAMERIAAERQTRRRDVWTGNGHMACAICMAWPDEAGIPRYAAASRGMVFWNGQAPTFEQAKGKPIENSPAHQAPHVQTER